MNRRSQYRVRPGFDEAVSIELHGPKVHARNVRLLDISAGGAGLELPESASGMLLTGDTVDLRVLSDQLLGPVQMKGRICHLDEARARPRVGMAFVDWRQHRALLDSDLRSLFNEREAYRVEPEPGQPVRVELTTGPGRRLRCDLYDISVLGVAVVVPRRAADSVDEGRILALSIHLPGSRQPVAVRGHVRHVRRQGDEAVAGLRLVADERQMPVIQRQISGYVMARQREMCRLGLGRAVA